MKTGLMICTLFISTFAHAQTWDEWFRQKQTKLKYIAQQIAAFEVYAGYLKKGYEIVDEGWSTINDVKHGDFDLHDNYFNSLKQVNNAIGGYDKVEDITNVQSQILEVNDAIEKLSQDDHNLQEEEKDYIKKVMSNLLQKCANNLDELKIIISNDSLTMKDDERLTRIDNLYADMKDKYSFAQFFLSEIQTLALSRAKGTNDLNTLKLLYQIK